MRSGICAAQPTSAPAIDASECSFWPTATAEDSEASGGLGCIERGIRGPSLTDVAVRQWPTPTAVDDGTRCGRRQNPDGKGGRVLSEDATKWPTPLSTDGNGARPADGKRSTGLNTHASLWATPLKRDYRSGLGTQQRVGTPALPEQVTKWATPRAEDGESCGNHPGAHDSLTGQTRMWPTPTAEPYGSSQNGINGLGGENERPSAATPSLERMSHSFLPLLVTSPDGDASSVSDPTSRRHSKLNPQFVECLMGWPIGWTGSAPAATAWCHWQQRMRSSLWPLVPGCARTDR
jgi:hypothetical protein